MQSLESLLKGQIGNLIVRPWFDRAALEILCSWYFPLSRAWAAGLAADGDLDRFRSELPDRKASATLSRPALARLKKLAVAHDAAEWSWQQAFFGREAVAIEQLQHLEAARLDASHALMSARALFIPMAVARRPKPVRWAMPAPETVEARHGARLAQLETAFDLKPTPPIRTSRAVPLRGEAGQRFWLKGTSAGPVAEGDFLWATVSEPEHPKATLILGSGIGMEPEHWRGQLDHGRGFRAAGLRVIVPESAWHGRRRLNAMWGGEPVLAGGPMGLIDFLAIQVRELGQLVAWARARWPDPVVLGGISLGAMTSQLAATAARDWPREAHPDALFLVTPSASMTAVAFTGSLTRGLGVDVALRKAGWSPRLADRWRPLMEPRGEPVVPPAAIIAVLGQVDDVTPYPEGDRLAADWKLPEANVFRWPLGHFSTAMELDRDDAPLKRLWAALTAAETADAMA